MSLRSCWVVFSCVLVTFILVAQVSFGSVFVCNSFLLSMVHSLG